MSDQIIICCPHCQGESSVDAASAGQVVSCPHCSGKLTVPDAPEVVSQELPILQSPVLPEPPMPQSPLPPVPQSQLPPVPQSPLPPVPQSPPAFQGGQGVSPMIIETLTRTRGWVRFFSILGFIACGLLALGGLGIVMLGESTFGSGYGYGPDRGTLILIGLLYLGGAVLYFYPSLRLTQYANRISTLEQSHSEQDLLSALEMQRSFWAMVGIMAIVTISIYLLVIVVAIGGLL
jgi:hypothetical protein